MKKNFDISNWEIFSNRRNSTSYVSKDKKWMIKIYSEFGERSVEALEEEKENTLKAIEAGIKTPKVDDVVELPDGKYGLIFEYVEGKSSISRALSKDIKNAEMYIEKFAKLAKETHSKVCDINKFESTEKRIIKIIEKTELLNEIQKKKAMNLINTIEKKNTFLLGDFHTGNFIIANDREFLIDLDFMGYGNPIYDVAVFYFFTHFMPGYVTRGVFHVSDELVPKMWYDFARYYYDTDNDEELMKISDDMKKYAIVLFFNLLGKIKPGTEIQDIMDRNFDELLKDY